MQITKTFAIALIFAAAPLAIADESYFLFDAADGCMEGPLEQFGRYIGDWNIEDESLAQDGSGWGPGNGARWIFSCLGNGTAIQDFWVPNGGPVGTNLRTWNTETESWDIAWTIKGIPSGFAHIQANEDEKGNIVMNYKSPIPDPLRKITFFPPDENGWNWKLEFSSDAGETWTEVYRIKATPWQEEAD
jgi:hypothetical protein